MLIAALFVLACVCDLASAHESRPLYVEIDEKAPGRYVVTWKIPPSALSVTSPTVLMPKVCQASAPPAGSKLIKRQLFICNDNLSGRKIAIKFPGYNPSISTLFRFHRLSGEKHTAIQGPKEPSWTVPQRETTASVAKQYLWLGIEHILLGFDHLLFVACLMFIAGTLRRVLITITGFTLAHSITLSLAALDIVRVPVPPVEAAIALSIIFLAVEIVRDRRDTITWRFPVVVASSFGLLHGFGFATVLRELGLPQVEIPAALLSFNVGVEIGQILFVAALVAVVMVVRSIGLLGGTTDRQLANALPAHVTRVTGYIIGALATFWLYQRLENFVTL